MILLGNRIHVAPVIIEQQGAIIFPEICKGIQGYGLWRVLDVGPGRLTKKGVRIPVECEKDDRLITTHVHSGALKLSDGTAILDEDQVLAVMKPTPTTS